MRKSPLQKKRETLYGKEITDFIKINNYVTYDMMELAQIKTKSIFVKFVCDNCNNEVLCRCYQVLKRKSYLKKICYTCLPKVMCNNVEWRKKNSDAQLLIQSTPEQKLKNSLGVSKFWKENPEIKQQMAENVKKAYEDPEVRERWLRSMDHKQASALAGIYKFDSGIELEFGSSYELCFLKYIEETHPDWIIRRCEWTIKYRFNERNKTYLPDYLLILNDKKILIEIKSTRFQYYDANKQKAKLESINSLISGGNIDEYWFIDEEHELAKSIDFKRSTKIKPLCKILYKNNKLKLFSKDKQLKYIGSICED